MDSFYAWCVYGLYLPFVTIGVLLAHYSLRRALWRRRKRSGRGGLGFYPSSVALGAWLQFVQVYHQPSVAYVLEEKQREDADEDDSGEPENVEKQLHRQLRRIRRGDPVDWLVLRM